MENEGGVDSERLIELVRNYPQLYDKAHSKYRNNRMKDEIWKQISEEMGMPDTSKCKKRWTYLRDKFQKEQRRSSLLPPNDPAAAVSWGYYDNLLFLKKCVKSSLTADENESVHSTAHKEKNLYMWCNDEEEVRFDDIMTTDEGTDINSSNCYKFNPDSSSVKRKPDDTHLNELIGLIKKKCNDDNSSTETETHIDHFCTFVKSYLKKFPEHGQDDAISHITTYLVNKNKEFAK